MEQLLHPRDVSAAFKDFAIEIGPKAAAHLSITTDSVPCYCGIYPNGHSARAGGVAEYFSVRAGSWDELLVAAREEWAQRSDLNAENKTKALALKIIELTFQHGECTDAMLRADFDAAEVERYGAQAVERANTMAERGPFEIIRLAGANARAA